jgi:hypothetical protein
MFCERALAEQARFRLVDADANSPRALQSLLIADIAQLAAIHDIVIAS